VVVNQELSPEEIKEAYRLSRIEIKNLLDKIQILEAAREAKEHKTGDVTPVAIPPVVSPIAEEIESVIQKEVKSLKLSEDEREMFLKRENEMEDELVAKENELKMKTNILLAVEEQLDFYIHKNEILTKESFKVQAHQRETSTRIFHLEEQNRSLSTLIKRTKIDLEKTKEDINIIKNKLNNLGSKSDLYKCQVKADVLELQIENAFSSFSVSLQDALLSKQAFLHDEATSLLRQAPNLPDKVVAFLNKINENTISK
jgi:hypothetical protein